MDYRRIIQRYLWIVLGYQYFSCYYYYTKGGVTRHAPHSLLPPAPARVECHVREYETV